MYEKHFGLKTKPFELVPNPDFLYVAGSHKKALTYLHHGIKGRIGFILMTGEVGSGKTTLLRAVTKNLESNVTISRVFNTKVTSDQMIALINEDFGLNTSGKEKVSMLRDLNDFLIDQYAKERQPVVIIDEAQNLKVEQLEEIRMLSNLETSNTKLLQMLLVGQPELWNTLASPELRQLRQRISISCHLLPLAREETEGYVYHRLQKAGGNNSLRFKSETIDTIHDFSRGVPRLVNILCDFLLLAAFTEGTKEVSVDLAREVAEELERENRYWQDLTQCSPAAHGSIDELSAQMNNDEARISRHLASPAEVTSLEARLAEMQKSVGKEIRQLRSYLWEMEVKMRTLGKDLSEIRRLLANLEELRRGTNRDRDLIP